MKAEEEKWHRRFLEHAKHVAQWSKDPSVKVGAVIVDPETKQVIGSGYNGFARGVDDTPERYADRETKLGLVCHAELNAILGANQSVRGCDMYVYPTFIAPVCCSECAKLIVQSGIKRVFGYHCDTVDLADRWKKQAEYAWITLNEGGVEYNGDIIEHDRRELPKHKDVQQLSMRTPPVETRWRLRLGTWLQSFLSFRI
jgi:dCMP deaminase